MDRWSQLGVRNFAHHRRLRLSTRHYRRSHRVDEDGEELAANVAGALRDTMSASGILRRITAVQRYDRS